MIKIVDILKSHLSVNKEALKQSKYFRDEKNIAKHEGVIEFIEFLLKKINQSGESL